MCQTPLRDVSFRQTALFSIEIWDERPIDAQDTRKSAYRRLFEPSVEFGAKAN